MPKAMPLVRGVKHPRSLAHVNFGTWTCLGGLADGLSNTGKIAFGGGVFDGQSVWLVPNNADAVVRVNVSDGGMTAFNGWPSDVALSVGNYALGGGCVDMDGAV
jgi:hypothetical protein